MISRTRAGSSPAFEKVCHWPRGLKMSRRAAMNHLVTEQGSTRPRLSAVLVFVVVAVKCCGERAVTSDIEDRGTVPVPRTLLTMCRTPTVEEHRLAFRFGRLYRAAGPPGLRCRWSLLCPPEPLVLLPGLSVAAAITPPSTLGIAPVLINLLARTAKVMAFATSVGGADSSQWVKRCERIERGVDLVLRDPPLDSWCLDGRSHRVHADPVLDKLYRQVMGQHEAPSASE